MASAIPVSRDTVVSLKVEMYDAHGVQLDAPAEPVTYLHGGYGGLLGALERAVEGKRVGEAVQLQVEPDDAFGEYDANLVRVEPTERYGEGVAIGMEVEDAFEDEAPRLYTVTDVAEGKVVLDGNHPLAGIALRFVCEVVDVRTAKPEEIRQGVSLPQA